MASEIVRAPWNQNQVDSLNMFQECGWMHEYTGDREALVATKEGWVNKGGVHVVQDWAHDWSANWEWLSNGLGMPPEFAANLEMNVAYIRDAHNNRTKSGKPQTRSDGSPYYFHPIRVLIRFGSHFRLRALPPELSRDTPGGQARLISLIYAILWHDLREDTLVTLEELCEMNHRAGIIVEALTKPDKTDKDRGAGHVTYTLKVYRKYETADLETRIAKSFDRIHNLEDSAHQRQDWRRRYLDDTGMLLSYLEAPCDIPLKETFFAAIRKYYDEVYPV
jgi:hypothetical protein